MYGFSDFLVLCCLFLGGFFVGYYCKFAYIYDNPWTHWYALVGMAAALLLGAVWTLKKYKQRQYQYDHFYVIFYGLICFIISSCFMLTDNMDTSFYFGFIGLAIMHVASYSYVALRCDSRGLRPMRVALAHAVFQGGLITGFVIFNELEPETSGWWYLGLILLILAGVVVNEVMQYMKKHDYKKSADVSFNLLNDDKLVFLNSRQLRAFFASRPEYYFMRDRQWLTVVVAYLLIAERTFLFSPSYLHLAWSATFAALTEQHLYGPFLLYTLGCLFGAGLLCRYQPKVMYQMMSLIKITALAAILGVYVEERPEDCFPFVCFYYFAIGVYSSVAVQMIVECSPMLYKELLIAVAFVVEFGAVEAMKYELRVDESWPVLLGVGVSTIVVSLLCGICVQLLLPPSAGLLDMRNRLIGVRRHEQGQKEGGTNIWHANNFYGHHVNEDKMKVVRFNGSRIFHQYPSDPSEAAAKNRF